MKISESLKEIAHWISADPAVLKAAIDEYNAACDEGHDRLFAKQPEHLIPVRTPPFYALKCSSIFLDTIGGIKINERMEVISQTGKPITGLYAAGVVMVAGRAKPTALICLEARAVSHSVPAVSPEKARRSSFVLRPSSKIT